MKEQVSCNARMPTQMRKVREFATIVALEDTDKNLICLGADTEGVAHAPTNSLIVNQL
jgi:hypothetical protein